jgi:hypothetical protein
VMNGVSGLRDRGIRAGKWLCARNFAVPRMGVRVVA